MILITIFVVSFLITLAATPLTIKLALKYGLVDNPKLRLHPANTHKKTIPRAGGLAIYLAVVFTMAIFLSGEKYLIGIITGISILLITGLIDDKKNNFSPYIRLGLVLISATVVVLSGVGISFISNPLYGLDIFTPLNSNQFIRFDQIIIPIYFFGSHSLVLIADLFAFIYIVAITQIINWSKGVDGQMPGITLVSAITLGLLSFKLYLGGDPNQFSLVKLALIIAGTSFGFLFFNWHPAKIFPGFSGSTILALMLATLSILSGAKVATALLVLAVPSVDFIYTILRRISKGHSPVWGDRGHLHHRLLDLGLTHPQISLFYIFISAILGTIALIIDSQSKFFGVLVVGIFFLGFILVINSLVSRKN